MDAFTITYISAILLWGINLWTLIWVIRSFGSHSKKSAEAELATQRANASLNLLESEMAELRFDIHNWIESLGKKIMEVKKELNKDAGYIKSRLSKAKTRQLKDLKQEKKSKRK